MYPSIPTVDVKATLEMKARDDVRVLDVREQWEYEVGHIPDVLHLPMSQIANRVNDIPTDKTLIVTCKSGQRSGRVTNWLKHSGYQEVYNMQGGILAWNRAGYTVENANGEPAASDWLITYNMLTRQMMG